MPGPGERTRGKLARRDTTSELTTAEAQTPDTQPLAALYSCQEASAGPLRKRIRRRPSWSTGGKEAASKPKAKTGEGEADGLVGMQKQKPGLSQGEKC